MTFADGRVKLTELDYQGRIYNLCYQYMGDMSNFSLVLIDGEYAIPAPAILWSSGWVHVPGPQDPQTTVNKMIADLNEFLKKQFGIPVQPSWAETVLSLIMKIIFFLDAGIPQVKIKE